MVFNYSKDKLKIENFVKNLLSLWIKYYKWTKIQLFICIKYCISI